MLRMPVVPPALAVAMLDLIHFARKYRVLRAGGMPDSIRNQGVARDAS
jgi:hypothetical protein